MKTRVSLDNLKLLVAKSQWYLQPRRTTSNSGKQWARMSVLII